jgi:DNA-binding transcriptional ArsR family regulator
LTTALLFGYITNKEIKMTKQETQRCETRAKILKALAHPSRLFTVEKLNEKPHCVCELADMIGIDMSTASKHLSILKNAGLVDDVKKGTTVYYSLLCACIMEFIGCLETVVRQNLDRASAYFKKSSKK